jgi:hypothetical protein
MDAQAAVWRSDSPPRSTRQRDPQQARPTDKLTLALDRLGFQSKPIKIRTGRKPLQQARELVRQDRGDVMHLPLESSRPASRQTQF